MKLSELSLLVADCLGVEITTVRQYARAIREAGLTTQGNSGAGAAHVDALDAAHFLIAICGSPGVIARCADSTLRFAALGNRAGVSFAQALETMIQNGCSGSVRVMMQRRPGFHACISDNGHQTVFEDTESGEEHDQHVVVSFTQNTINALYRELYCGGVS